jgi:hypothetical protein
MAASVVSADYSAITTIGTLENPCSDTASLFDCSYTDTELSAIDKYIENCKEINKLWVGKTNVSPEFARLLLLGYVSAVESYVRTILRSIINMDTKAQSDAHSYVIPFGAALYHEKSVLAEALLEGYSFASEREIKKALEKFLEISNVSDGMKSLLADFEKICQMRHCCVHRFGKLGSQNGIALGLAAHSQALEKPLSLDITSLGDIASWLMSFAKALNNYLFRTMLDRSVNQKNPYRTAWSWNYSKDRARFERVYKLFATIKDGTASPEAKELYGRFRLAKRLIQKAKKPA